MFVVDVRGIMRRLSQDPRSASDRPAAHGSSRSAVAGFAPDPVRQPVRGSARVESPVRGGALWLLIGVLSSLAVGCAETHDRTAPRRLVSAPRRRPTYDDVVIQGHGPSAVPVAARRVGERFLSGTLPSSTAEEAPTSSRGRPVSFAASCDGRGCGCHPRGPRAPQGSSACRARSNRQPRSWSPRSSMTAISPPTRSPRSSSGGPGPGRSPGWPTIDVPWQSPLRNESASAHSLAGCLRRPP